MDAATSLDSPKEDFHLGWRVTPLRLAGALTLLAVTVRLIGIEARPLWLDEAYSAWFSSQSWQVLWTKVPTYETHPPFYYSLLKLWRHLWGGSPLALRSFSLLFAAGTIPVVLAASGELERARPSGRSLLRAAIAAFLVACSPMLVLVGGEARPYPLLVFAFALGLLGVLRLTREFAESGPGKWASWLLLACGAELGLWAHGLGLLYGLCLGAALAPAWLTQPSRTRIARGALCAAAIVLLYLPCFLMMTRRAGDWGTGWLSWKPVMILQLLSLYTVPVEVLTVGSAVAALVIVLLFKRALQASFENPGWSGDRAILLLWWGPPILAIVISQFVLPVFLIRTLTPTLVPAALALGGALARMTSPKERLVLGAALVITLTPAAVQIALRPATEQWDQVAAFLDRNVRPGDEIWLYPNDSALPLREAGAKATMHGVPGDYPAVGIRGPIRAGSPAVVSLTADQALATARQPRLGAVPRIWLVTRQGALFDPKNELPRALAAIRRPGGLQQWGYINVQPYSRR